MSEGTEMVQAVNALSRRLIPLLLAWTVMVVDIGLTVYIFMHGMAWWWSVTTILGGLLAFFSAMSRERYATAQGTVVVSILPVVLLTLAFVPSAIPFFVILFS